jgi:hypothetical protein
LLASGQASTQWVEIEANSCYSPLHCEGGLRIGVGWGFLVEVIDCKRKKFAAPREISTGRDQAKSALVGL